eukprot:scaffold236466_cov22-Tisochrysis_lutea.AAC.1
MLVQRRTKKFEAQTVSWPVYGDKPLNNHGSVPAWTHPVRRIARRSTWSLSTHGVYLLHYYQVSARDLSPHRS